MNVNNFE